MQEKNHQLFYGTMLYFVQFLDDIFVKLLFGVSATIKFNKKYFFYMIFKIIMKIYLTYTFKLKINYIRKQKYRYNDDN